MSSSYYYGLDHVFSSRKSNATVNLMAGSNETLVLHGSATQSTPTDFFSFSSDSDTGTRYNSGSGKLALVSNGSNIIEITSTSVIPIKPIYLPTGIATNPSLAWSENSDTGLFYEGYRIRAAIDGIERLSIGDTTMRVSGQVISEIGSNSAYPAFTFGDNQYCGLYLTSAANGEFGTAHAGVGPYTKFSSTGNTNYRTLFSFTPDAFPTFHQFYNNVGTTVGSISSNGVTTFFNTTSSIKLKRDIHPTYQEESIDIIKKVKPSRYRWKSELNNDCPESWGLIAEELSQVFPSAVSSEKEYTYDNETKTLPASIDYSKLIVPMIDVIQNLLNRIENLEKNVLIN